VAALVARSRGDERGDVAMGSPPPFRAPAVPDTWQGDRAAPRSMRDAIDAELSDDLADDIDQQVAAELSGRAVMPGNFEATTATAPAYDDGGDDELPFDPEAARAFDMVMRRQASPNEQSTVDGGAPSYVPPASYGDGADGATRLGMPPGLIADAEPEPYEGHFGGTTGEGSAYDGYADPPGYAAAPDAPVYSEAPVYDGTIDELAAALEGRPLEDVLEEADDYAAQGLIREAIGFLRALASRHPNHPLVTMRLRDLEAAAAAPGEVNGTQTVDVDDLEELAPEELDADIDPSDDVAVAFDEAQRVIAGRHGSAVGKRRPAVVLEKPVEDSDADTHFDLGLAYKEMGLYDEAIKAFDKCTSTPHREVQSRMMIGMCHREQGNLSEAVHQFKAGLHASAITDRERQSLLYEIGTSYEALGDPREAVYYYEMVVKRDPKFLDAAERMHRLQGGRGMADAAAAIDSLLDDD
jgi:tetratricopeptide (TPR) repeat protein